VEGGRALVVEVTPVAPHAIVKGPRARGRRVHFR
jgi:hypothetical protein